MPADCHVYALFSSFLCPYTTLWKTQCRHNMRAYVGEHTHRHCCMYLDIICDFFVYFHDRFSARSAPEPCNMLWTVFALLLCAVKIQTENICDDARGQDIVIDALRLNTIHLNLVNTRYTWQATRGTQNLTIHSTDDVTVTTSVSGRQLRIAATVNDANAASTCYASPALLIAVLACAMLSPRLALSRSTVFLMLTFTAV